MKVESHARNPYGVRLGKRMTPLGILLATCGLEPAAGQAPPSPSFGTAVPALAAPARSLPKLGALRLPLIENRGQFDPEVAFQARIAAGKASIQRDGTIVYSFSKRDGAGLPIRATLRQSLVGARSPKVRGETRAASLVNYFRGNDRSRWKTDIPTYDLVSLGEMYPGVEVKLKTAGQNVETLFHVKPGGNPRAIRFRLDGGQGIRLTSRGELEIETAVGRVQYSRPFAYQEEEGRRAPVEVAYARASGDYGFRLGRYDRSREVVIDPIVAATYLGGGSDGDSPDEIAIDKDGNVYAAGMTLGDIPGVGPGSADSFAESPEGFIVKLSPDLSTILAATYIGGDVDCDPDIGCGGLALDSVWGIAFDAAGNVYAAGGTQSEDFPGVGPGSAETTPGSGFVAKLTPNLDDILGATFVDGHPYDIAIREASGTTFVCIVGTTTASDFPDVGPTSADNVQSGSEGFVARVSSDLSQFLGATYLGGTSNDEVTALAIDGAGNLHVTGRTRSPDFPGVGPQSADSTISGNTTFVAELTPDFSDIVAATFLGGTRETSRFSRGPKIALDAFGNTYVAGQTHSPDFPGIDAGSADQTIEKSEAFLAKLNPGLAHILASTFLGGSDDDSVGGVTLDSAGDVYVSGSTRSPDFPGVGSTAADTSFAAGEAFVARLSPDLATVTATFLGGTKEDVGSALALDGAGNIYVTGSTYSSDFPGVGPGAAQPELSNNPSDGFVVKLSSVDGGNRAPDVSRIRCGRTPCVIWPADGRIVDAPIRGVTDPDGDPVQITIWSIRQDEPIALEGHDLCPSATGVGTDTAHLRAARSPRGDGRVYHVAFSAEDGKGGVARGQVRYCVPLDGRRGARCGDQGPRFDSTDCRRR